MSQRAVERLSKKLDAAALTGESIEIGEEMRHLTLQVDRCHRARIDPLLLIMRLYSPA